jgi:hypothetical protein
LRQVALGKKGSKSVSHAGRRSCVNQTAEEWSRQTTDVRWRALELTKPGRVPRRRPSTDHGSEPCINYILACV